MDLRDRRARNWRQVESLEQFCKRFPEDPGDRGFDFRRRKRRHPVLQERELVGDVGRQQIAPRRQHLAELDEDWAQVLERASKAHRARRAEVTPEERPADDRPEQAQPRVVEREVVETVLERDDDNPGEATKPHRLF